MSPESFMQKRMVEEQLVPRGIRDLTVLKAMLAVPRHSFVESYSMEYAYQDGPLPIGNGQTISQPYIVALMTQSAELGPDDVVLDIGTGSGYAAAVLAQIVKQVYSIERIPSLANEAAERFRKLRYANIESKVGDGTLGWPEKAPFDAIIVTAGAPIVPENLISQLKPSGRLIIPVGDSMTQELLCLRRPLTGKITREMIELVRFVPLIGKQGWKERL